MADADGNIMVNGHVQGTIPTPVGMLSGQVTGGFASTDQGWGTFVDADGTLRMPSGVTLNGGLTASYSEDQHGSHTSVEVEGSASMAGFEVGGGLGYERIEQDGDVVEGFHAEGHAEGLGMSITGEADYVHTNIDGVEQSDWSTDANFDGPGLDDLPGVLSTVAGAAGGSDVGDVTFDAMDHAPADDMFAIADDLGASLNQLTEDL